MAGKIAVVVIGILGLVGSLDSVGILGLFDILAAKSMIDWTGTFGLVDTLDTSCLQISYCTTEL